MPVRGSGRVKKHLARAAKYEEMARRARKDSTRRKYLEVAARARAQAQAAQSQRERSVIHYGRRRGVRRRPAERAAREYAATTRRHRRYVRSAFAASRRNAKTGRRVRSFTRRKATAAAYFSAGGLPPQRKGRSKAEQRRIATL